MNMSKILDSFFGSIYALFKQRENEAVAERYQEIYEKADISDEVPFDDLGALSFSETPPFSAEKIPPQNMGESALSHIQTAAPLITFHSTPNAYYSAASEKAYPIFIKKEAAETEGAAAEAVFNSIGGQEDTWRRAETDRTVFNSELAKSVGAEISAPKTVFNSEIVSGLSGVERQTEIERTAFNSEIAKSAGSEISAPKAVFNSEVVNGLSGVERQTEIEQNAFKSEIN